MVLTSSSDVEVRLLDDLLHCGDAIGFSLLIVLNFCAYGVGTNTDIGYDPYTSQIREPEMKLCIETIK